MIDQFAVINDFVKFKNLKNKKKLNSIIWKINNSQLEKLSNILGVLTISKK